MPATLWTLCALLAGVADSAGAPTRERCFICLERPGTNPLRDEFQETECDCPAEICQQCADELHERHAPCPNCRRVRPEDVPFQEAPRPCAEGLDPPEVEPIAGFEGAGAGPRQVVKPCPGCNAPVAKENQGMGNIERCNHMECANCGTHWCWLCNQDIGERNPYGHFNGGCCDDAMFQRGYAAPPHPERIDDAERIMNIQRARERVRLMRPELDARDADIPPAVPEGLPDYRNVRAPEPGFPRPPGGFPRAPGLDNYTPPDGPNIGLIMGIGLAVVIGAAIVITILVVICRRCCCRRPAEDEAVPVYFHQQPPPNMVRAGPYGVPRAGMPPPTQIYASRPAAHPRPAAAPAAAAAPATAVEV